MGQLVFQKQVSPIFVEEVANSVPQNQGVNIPLCNLWRKETVDRFLEMLIYWGPRLIWENHKNVCVAHICYSLYDFFF